MPAIAPATIAELARRSGVDVASIRLYQQIGLLPRRAADAAAPAIPPITRSTSTA